MEDNKEQNNEIRAYNEFYKFCTTKEKGKTSKIDVDKCMDHLTSMRNNIYFSSENGGSKKWWFFD